ncbi:MAG: FAD-binding oxidoreductase [Desulfobulbaceae bacterium]|nr:FAD-binding oxidoreductase [Desulfobulbaceae bacterium]
MLLADTIKDTLSNQLSPGAVLSEPEALHKYCSDASGLHFIPELVVRAQNTEDIQTLLRLANAYGFPVTPRGGGSGLAGACLAHQGGVVLSLEDLNRIRLIDHENFLMEAEAGVISQKVREVAWEAGMFYPPDPAGMDLSTIGGNAATDAGGPACVKYGTTRDYILGLEAVLPNGECVRTGVRTRKGVVGYDLTNLLVGSEGTLAVITALLLKLLPKPAAVQTLLCAFPSVTCAMENVATIMQAGHLPCAIEVLDHRCLALVGELLPFALPAGKPSLLILELDGPATAIAEEMETIRKLMLAHGTIDTLPATNSSQRQKIWEVRRQVSLRIHDYAALYLSEDVTVPISAIAPLVNALPDYEKRYQLEIFAFGHAGDGNIHLNITTQDVGLADRAHAGVRALLALVLDLGGTISGEHGIGIAKKPYIAMELPEPMLALQRSIKEFFDPNKILNPGKIFP